MAAKNENGTYDLSKQVSEVEIQKDYRFHIMFEKLKKRDVEEFRAVEDMVTDRDALKS